VFNLMAKRRGYLDQAHKAKGGGKKGVENLFGAPLPKPSDEAEARPAEAGAATHHAKLAEHHKAIAGLHEALSDHHGSATQHGADHHGRMAEHHSAMADRHHGLHQHHLDQAAADEAGNPTEAEPDLGESPSEETDEALAEPAPGEETEGPGKPPGIALALAFGKAKPPDTIESAKYGPPETEEEETPEHEAGESKEVEAIEEGRKEQPGTKRIAGGSLRNSEEEEPLSKKKETGFRKYRKTGERA
jgi:hypothetical protein